MNALSALEVTNSCVVVCDLVQWPAQGPAAWRVLKGSQDEVGSGLAGLLAARGCRRLDDFGGVAKTFLCSGDEYASQPPRTSKGGAIFSFTPKNKVQVEGLAMADVAAKAGYDLLVLTVQKEGKFGKVWVLDALLRHLAPDDASLVYYEDTAAIVDGIKATPQGNRVRAVHVLAPGFEHERAARADETITQAQYLDAVLAPSVGPPTP